MSGTEPRGVTGGRTHTETVDGLLAVAAARLSAGAYADAVNIAEWCLSLSVTVRPNGVADVNWRQRHRAYEIQRDAALRYMVCGGDVHTIPPPPRASGRAE